MMEALNDPWFLQQAAFGLLLAVIYVVDDLRSKR